MIITLISWMVILFLAISIGSVWVCFIAPDSFSNTSKIDVYVVAGIMFINVYAQIYSLFSNVGKTAFYLLCAVAAVCALYQMSVVKTHIIKSFSVISTWQFCLLLIVITLVGLYTMKAPSHFDTYLYHAQAIRWIEEYGVVPGLGNLHNRFAYNSASMPLHALFSFSWLFEQPLHSVNGFLCCFFVSFALISNKLFTKHESRLSDILKCVIVVYVYMNRKEISSVGSDIPAMLLAIYVICKWSECSETREDIQSYGAVCLFTAWAVSLKLSVVTCMLLVLYPAVILIREKKWKTILVDLVSGMIILVPWLIRNVIISGYILYPYAGIDLFDCDWKMPPELLDYDRKEIIVWGRGVNDVARFDESIMQWFSTWYSTQTLSGKIFIITGFFATLALIILFLVKLMRQPSDRYDIKSFFADASAWLLIFTIIICEVFWLFSAPLLRYGMIYLLMPTAVLVYIVKQLKGGGGIRIQKMVNDRNSIGIMPYIFA